MPLGAALQPYFDSCLKIANHQLRHAITFLISRYHSSSVNPTASRAAGVDQVVDDGLSKGRSIGFSIRQPVTQVSLAVPLEERPASILGRPHAPILPRPTAFPYLPFHFLNDFVVVDGHGCSLSLESQILNLSA
jgi:hypothetical protein